MPIYEYRRKTDGSTFELEQRITEDPLTECPTTGAPVERLISASSFSLKGGGWYVTDYKAGASPAKETTPAAPESKSVETKKDSESTNPKELKAADKPAATEKPAATDKKD